MDVILEILFVILYIILYIIFGVVGFAAGAAAAFAVTLFCGIRDAFTIYPKNLFSGYVLCKKYKGTSTYPMFPVGWFIRLKNALNEFWHYDTDDLTKDYSFEFDDPLELTVSTFYFGYNAMINADCYVLRRAAAIAINAALILVFFLPFFASSLLCLIVKLIDHIISSRIHTDHFCYKCGRSYYYADYTCSCGRSHPHLVPGRLGIFRHTCKCRRKLRCTALFGRLELPVACSSCGSNITGMTRKLTRIAVTGLEGSGVTSVSSAMLDSLITQAVKNNGYDTVLSPGEKNAGAIMDEISPSFKNRKAVRSYSYTISYPLFITSNGKRHIVFHDIPLGENITQLTRENICFADSIVLVLDLTQQSPELAVRELYSVFVSESVIKQGKKYKPPVYILLAKTDLLGVRDKIGINQAAPSGELTGLRLLNAWDTLCREYLRRADCEYLIKHIDDCFRKAYIISASAFYPEPECTAAMRFCTGSGGNDIFNERI